MEFKNIDCKWWYEEYSRVYQRERVDESNQVNKDNKPTDESGMIAEYIKALGDQDLNNLIRLLNDVLMGGCIPREWKEISVVLVHKGGHFGRCDRLSRRKGENRFEW